MRLLEEFRYHTWPSLPVGLRNDGYWRAEFNAYNPTIAVLTDSNGLSRKRKECFAHSLAWRLNLAPGNQAASETIRANGNQDA